MKRFSVLLAACLVAAAVSETGEKNKLLISPSKKTLPSQPSKPAAKPPVRIITQPQTRHVPSQQYRPPIRVTTRTVNEDVFTEKRYVTVITPDDPFPFMINTATADLWKLSPAGNEWFYLGDPRGAQSGRVGRYRLSAFQAGQVFILDTETGEAWIADGNGWLRIDDPSTRTSRYKGSPRTWDQLWEEFQRQGKDQALGGRR